MAPASMAGGKPHPRAFLDFANAAAAGIALDGGSDFVNVALFMLRHCLLLLFGVMVCSTAVIMINASHTHPVVLAAPTAPPRLR